MIEMQRNKLQIFAVLRNTNLLAALETAVSLVAPVNVTAHWMKLVLAVIHCDVC
jgi:hypothetical protein